MRYGSGRIIDVREGPNVRRKFDGARAMLSAGGWQLDGLAVQPTVVQTGVFDDRIDDRQQLWGVYAMGRPFGAYQALELYYLGFRDEWQTTTRAVPTNIATAWARASPELRAVEIGISRRSISSAASAAAISAPGPRPRLSATASTRRHCSRVSA